MAALGWSTREEDIFPSGSFAIRLCVGLAARWLQHLLAVAFSVRTMASGCLCGDGGGGGGGGSEGGRLARASAIGVAVAVFMALPVATAIAAGVAVAMARTQLWR